MKSRLIGIIGAMPEEINGVVQQLQKRKEHTRGMRTYYEGILHEVPVIVVFSRWGKVAAAITCTTLITEFGITELVFTGVAGAIHHDLNIGDVVVGSRFIQHDMDASPIIKRHELPLLGAIYLDCDQHRVKAAMECVQVSLATSLPENIDRKTMEQFGISTPKVVEGVIASGDKFFSSHKEKEALLSELPDVMCVEMEGAAVAQVCFEYKIPYTIIRTISDTADDSAHIDFTSFIKEVSSIYSVEIVKKLLELH